MNPPIFNPNQFREVEDLLVPLGSFYFSNVHHGIMKKTPKKRKLEESPSQPEAPQVLVSSMKDATPKQMARETISTMRAFASASVYTIEAIISELGKKETQIKELQDQKVGLESALDQQSVTLKTQFNCLLEEERAHCSKELEDTRLALEFEKSQMMIEHANHISIMEQRLANLKLKVTGLEEFKEEAIKVNDNLKISENDFYQSLSQIQQSYHVLVMQMIN